ncbi:Dihydrofolate reductase [Parasponia andersonii]|uniref:dihydrofolate reductase n=1 Tax=Parasponia andersonii TaxID=3476 RepID=A0A2P5E5H1_PARAD|nr:Dihydrofolate reductase [Parasponia andersonii]
MGIGKDGKLPWRLPSDLKFFNDITVATSDSGKKNVAVMGRKTWESIPLEHRPLPGCLNVVLTRSGSFDIATAENVVICGSVASALELLAASPYCLSIEKVFVTGGGQILRSAFDISCCFVLPFAFPSCFRFIHFPIYRKTHKDDRIGTENGTEMLAFSLAGFAMISSIGLTDREEGDFGPVYEFQWRHFGARCTDLHADYAGQGFDQLLDVIDNIKNNPDDQHIILSAWNPSDLKLMFRVILSMFGDAHVYRNHVRPRQEQLQKLAKAFSCKHNNILKINPEKKNIDSFVTDDFKLVGYDPDQKIDMKMAV